LSFVAFFKSNDHFNIAFVASKKIGNAVVRNKAKRRLRAIFLEYENKIQEGSYIFIAKEALNNRDFKGIKKDFDFAFKRLELFKKKND
jgi:ribonuclease P protein component